ncbi:MAG: thiamine pyrophosphate-binding protein [Myxococcales bacterium]|nr:thiamine pyrophosphate-binding protein [Myxococcales bacterium]
MFALAAAMVSPCEVVDCRLPHPSSPAPTGAELLVEALYALGVRRAFGVMGGAIARFCEAARRAGIALVHARHETGAVFMASEAHFATGEPVVVFTTTGPGATNAVTGLVSAVWDGAKVIAVVGGTNLAERGRLSFQETAAQALELTGWLGRDRASMRACIESGTQVPGIARRLATGLARPGGFVAALTVPQGVQAASTPGVRLPPLSHSSLTPVDVAQVARLQSRLCEGDLVIWAGFGTRHAAPALTALVERSGARVMCSPRAKGVFPESHPHYLGVTGMFGGQARVQEALAARPPDHVLVLGSRLGQATSCFDPAYLPRRALVHVDVDPSAFGAAYPETETIGVQATIEPWLDALVEAWPLASKPELTPVAASGALAVTRGPVHPRALMAAVQRRVVEQSNAVVLSDVGNAFAWANHDLVFDAPHRYRTAAGFGSMTQASAGVVGTALATRRPAVALVGDGAMLMGNEVSTAVQYQVPAKWIVLNDACYGMVHHGMVAVGMEPFETRMPRVDFVAFARALGAEGMRVTHAGELDEALHRMLEHEGPFVLDVVVDDTVPPPFGRRNDALGRAWE